jgi:hypothetical protein
MFLLEGGFRVAKEVYELFCKNPMGITVMSASGALVLGTEYENKVCPVQEMNSDDRVR